MSNAGSGGTMAIIVIAIAAVVVTTYAVISRRLTGMIACKTATVAFTTMAAISCTHAAAMPTAISTTVTTTAPVTLCVR